MPMQLPSGVLSVPSDKPGNACRQTLRILPSRQERRSCSKEPVVTACRQVLISRSRLTAWSGGKKMNASRPACPAEPPRSLPVWSDGLGLSRASWVIAGHVLAILPVSGAIAVMSLAMVAKLGQLRRASYEIHAVV